MIPSTLDVSRIRAITLDLDDTLWPVWPTIERAEAALRNWLGARAPRTAVLASDSDASRLARQAVLMARPGIRHDLGTTRLEVIRHLLGQAGENAALAEPAFDVFHAERQRVVLYDDVLPALERLSARYPIVALSNGNADVERVGIGEYFRAAVSAGEVGAAKPDRRIFSAAARAARVAEGAVLHVGDDPRLDGVGALAAGMQVAWVDRKSDTWPADLSVQPSVRVTDLLALCRLLDA